MSIFNCIFCGESAIVLGKSSYVIRSIKCKKCGLVEFKKNKLKNNTTTSNNKLLT